MSRLRTPALAVLACALANWHTPALGQSLVPDRALIQAADVGSSQPSAGAIQFEIFSNRSQWSGAQLLPAFPSGVSPSDVLPTSFEEVLPDDSGSEDANPDDVLPPSQDPNRSDVGEVQPPSTAPANPDGEERPLTDRGQNLGTIRLPPMPKRVPRDVPAKARKVEGEFGDGLTAKTEDGYFSLTFHNLTQGDGRFFNPTGNPLVDSFIIPRQRWYVLGNVSPNVRYYTVINRGYGSLDLLDAFIDINFGVIDPEKLQVRIGRMKTPYSYEYIKISETDLIAPERSVFIGNFAGNRQDGFMVHGDLLEKHFEYAVGLFNGPRRSFQAYTDAKNPYFFTNFKPFRSAPDNFIFQQLNLGGSFNCGDELNPVQPAALRTANDQSPSATAANVSPTFLTFNSNAFEDGWRMQWSADLVWYYRALGFMAAYQGGFATYGVSPVALNSAFTNATSPTQTHVPMSGYNFTTWYFLTGEEITRRVFLVEPRRVFHSFIEGGTGAIELFARYAYARLGDQVYSNGLVNAKDWSNQAGVTDVGVNWYLNHYTKLTFDYQYSNFGRPVTWGPNQFSSFCNIFWCRAQVFF